MPRLAQFSAFALIALSGAALSKSKAIQTIDGLETATGLDAVVFAEAPMISNPIAMDVDARGRVWLTEGHNYRNTIRPNYPVREEGDRIVILEDTDGDGRADTHKIYYQGRDIDAAMGILVLGNRVIVSAYEYVFMLIDHDGDDIADEKQIIYRRDPHDHDHGVHSFIFAPDGRLYFNTGDAGGPFRDPDGNVVVDRAGNEVVPEGGVYRRGLAMRVNMDWSGFEVVGHNFRNPFELVVDSYGSIWQTDNDDDGNRAVRVNYVMEYGNYGFTDERTGAGWRATRVDLESAIPLQHWYQNSPGVVPNLLQTGAGSPSGLAFYEGDLLPDEFRNAMIHADAGAPRVVRAYPTEKSGAGYTARMVNLLRSVDDPMFRPVDVAIAPDGSIFVADWYDPVVGGHASQNFDQGRIIRVAPVGHAYRVTPPDLSTAAGAVAALRSPSPGTRYLGHTRLRELGVAAEPALRQLRGDPNPRMRARALWLLAELDPRYVDEAIADADADLRITGLRAARLLELDVIGISERLAADPSPQVRREVAIALRNVDDPRAAGIWARLAAQHDGADRWYLEALGIAADGRWDAFFPVWLDAVGEAWHEAGGRDIIWRARTPAALPSLASLIRDGAGAASRLERYFRAFDFHEGPDREHALVGIAEGVIDRDPAITALALLALDSASLTITPELRALSDRALNAHAGSAMFVRLASRFDSRARLPEVVRLALTQPESETGIAAARLAARWGGLASFRTAIAGTDTAAARAAIVALSYIGRGEAQSLIEAVALDEAAPRALREAAILAFGRLPVAIGGGPAAQSGAPASGDRRLLQLLQAGQIPAELQEAAASVLFASPRGDVRSGAAEILPPPTAAGDALPPIEALALRTGDAARGQALYAGVCASCHQVNGAGVDFGPGLSDIGGKLGKEALHLAILQPNAGIAFNYEGSTLRLNDGSEIAGIIVSETSAEVAIKLPGGATNRYDRGDIALILPAERSLMPEEIGRALTEQQLVDLVEYLSTLR